MKKIQILFIALCMGAICAGCRHGKHTTIITENNNVKLRIEYSGWVVFNDDKSGVLNMSRDGYFKYEYNGQKISVKKTEKGIVYEVNDGAETDRLDADGQRLLKEAIVAVAKEQAKRKG